MVESREPKEFKKLMKILLVYPQYPDTFWSFKHALKFTSFKAVFAPLGLLTIAAMLPGEWEKKLVDLNVTSLTDKDIKWADYVFISAMYVQQKSAREIVDRCKKFGVKTVAGGPLFTGAYEPLGFDDVDHLVLNEAETTLAPFIADLQNGCAKHVYTSTERPDITRTPKPLWSLADKKKYQSMSIQYSRGCPFNCEFCDIIVLNGQVPRTKTKEQVIAELDALYQQGWRGGVFFVDDNFIGNKRKLKAEILPAIIDWKKAKGQVFPFITEASLNLADDEELMDLMSKAGFDGVFVGVESPNEESLNECDKMPNKGRDLLASVKTLQKHGFDVMGGFIVGFDNDPISIFKSQISFIQKSGIVTAMVGLLNAPPGTRLHHRLKKEDRLLEATSGDNTDGSMNFVPKMHYETLINGYKQVVKTIYSPKQYYNRVKVFLNEYKPKCKSKVTPQIGQFVSLIRSLWVLGVKERGRLYFWGLFISTLFRRPGCLPISIRLAIQGFHFRKVADKIRFAPVKISGTD